MRKLTPVALVLASFPLACGAATPAAKEGRALAQGNDSPSATGMAPASSAATADSPAAAEPSLTRAAANGPPPAATATASGDINPTADSDDPWLASHQMSSKDVLKVMRANNAKVQSCWKEGLKRDPSTSGEVKVRFVITNDGAVRAWRDDGSSMSDEDVTKCVGDVVQKLRFPKQQSPGDAWGVYSINFAP